MAMEGVWGDDLEPASILARGLSVPPFGLDTLLKSAALVRSGEVWIRGRDLDEAICFGEAHGLAQRTAGALIRDGLHVGDRVALLMPNHVAFGVAVWGIWQAGGAVCALHPAYAEPLLSAQLSDLSPHTLITIDEPDLLAKARKLTERSSIRLIVVPRAGPIDGATTGEGLPFAEWVKSPEPFAERACALDAIALLQFTAGSTGAPKAAMLTHRNLSSNLGQLIQVLPGLQPGYERVLAIAPFSHIIGFNVTLCLATYLASTVILEGRFDADKTAQLCLEQEVTFLSAVPTLLEGLNGSPVARAGSWRALKYVISGGAPIRSSTRATFEAMTGCDVLQGYGLSETSPAVLLGHPRWGSPPDSVGRPVPGTRVAVTATDDPSRFLESGEIGEIRVGGPQLMAGYWLRTEETAAALPGDLLRTGDLGKFDADGNVYIAGRLKELIIASGYNVYPARVEDAISTHEAVADTAVVGVPHSYRGETVKAVVVLKPEHSLTLEDLQAWLKPRLSPMEMPRLLEIRASLPKSPAGKTLKTELREPGS